MTFYSFVFDPQGNVVQKQYGGNTTNAPYSTASYEAYGKRDGEYDDFGGTPAHHQDPSGFGGQFGYYTDLETGLLCLTHRYYDPGTGKFLTRDPMGYDGGMNLYGFAGNNPVNRIDPEGTDALIVYGENHYGHDNGTDPNSWRRKAMGRAEEYEEQDVSGNSILTPTRPHHLAAHVVGVHTVQDFQDALKRYKNIDTLIYVGHGGPEVLAFGHGRLLEAKDVAKLNTGHVKQNAYIELDACDTGNLDDEIGQAFANRFQSDVTAYKSGFGASFGYTLFGHTFGDPNRVRVLPGNIPSPKSSTIRVYHPH